MEDSILISIKKLLGITEEYTHFDADLIMHINSVFMILSQLGVGPANGFSISDKNATWKDFLPDKNNLQAVKSFMQIKVKLLFDPPLGSAVMEAMNRLASELEWRLQVEAESTEEPSEEYEEYNGQYTVIPKAHDSQILDTANKVLDKDIVVEEVPYYETTNTANGITSYIAREGNSK